MMVRAIVFAIIAVFALIALQRSFEKRAPLLIEDVSAAGSSQADRAPPTSARASSICPPPKFYLPCLQSTCRRKLHRRDIA